MQYRESQGHESDLFLSYFRPCVIPTNGAKGKAEGEGKEPTLYQVKGRRFLHIRQVRRQDFCRGGGRRGLKVPQQSDEMVKEPSLHQMNRRRFLHTRQVRVRETGGVESGIG